MTTPSSVALWGLAYNQLSDKKKASIDAALPPASQSGPVAPVDVLGDLLTVTRALSQRELTIKLPNGEKFFVQNALQKITGYVKKFVEVGDTVVQYDPGHAALPWALLRLILQMSINSSEQRAAITEGVEEIAYYLAWSRIEERQLMVSYDNHSELERYFVDLYTQMLKFLARAAPTLQSKSRRVVTALFDGGSRFRKYLDALALCQTHIETLTRQILLQIGNDILTRSQHMQAAFQTVMDDARKIDVNVQSLSSDVLNIDTRIQNVSAEFQSFNTSVRRVVTETENIKFSIQDLECVTQRIEQLTIASLAIQQRNEQRHILDWISTIPYEKHLSLAEKKILSGTGGWLLDNATFRSWKRSSKSQLLCVLGGAGTGKSTLLSIVLRSLIAAHKTDRAPYPVFFFCSRNPAERERADPESILRSILRQLSNLPGGPPLHPTMEQRFGNKRTAGEISADEAVEMISEIISGNPSVYIVIDALDECDKDTRYILMEALSKILENAVSQVKIFLTSRDTQIDINLAMHGYPAVYIDAAQNSADIDLYIQHTVAQAIEKKRFLPGTAISPDLRTKIESNLKDGASGMFRWVELQIAFLQTIRRLSAFEARLGQLPPSLQKIYEDLYTQSKQNMIAEEAKVLYKTLLWLLVAQRPLKTHELRELVCAPGEDDLTDEAVLELCFDLVRLDRGTNQFRFAHLSVREFLEAHPDFENRKLQNEALETCLDILDTHTQNTWDSYSAIYWLPHVQAATESGLSEALGTRLDLLFQGSSVAYKAWNDDFIQIYESQDVELHTDAHSMVRGFLTDEASAILAVTVFGSHAQLVRLLGSAKALDIYGKCTDDESGDKQNVLMIAVQYDAVADAEILLQQSNFLNVYHKSMFCAVEFALLWGRYNIALVILDHLAHVFTQEDHFVNDLLSVSEIIYSCCDHMILPVEHYADDFFDEVLESLLELWAETEVYLDDARAAASYEFMTDAASRTADRVVGLMLDMGWVPTQAVFRRAIEALESSLSEQTAQDSGSSLLEQILENAVGRGASQDYSILLLERIIHLQSPEEHVKHIKVCLQYGADVNLPTASGKSVLETAMGFAKHEHMLRAVEALVECGALLCMSDADFTRVLTIAVMHADQQLLGLFLQDKEHVNAGLEYSHEDPCELCWQRRHLCVEHFAYRFIGTNINGLRILHAAVIEGFVNVVKILLDNGADTTILLADGPSVMDIAMLLRDDSEASLSLADDRSPVDRTMLTGYEEIIGLLRSHGASENPGFKLSIVETCHASFLLY